MKVLLFIGTMGSGGAERQLGVLAAGLAARGHEVTLATMFPGGLYWDGIGAEPGIRRQALFAARGGSPAAVAFQLVRVPGRLRRLVRATGCDVLHSQLEIPNLLAALAVGRHGPPLAWGILNSGPSGWKVRAADRVCARLSPRVPLVISNSRAGRVAAAARGYRPPAWAVVPNGFDTDVFRPDRAGGLPLRRAWLDGAAGPLVGLIGRHDARKGLDEFVGAAARVVRDLPGCRFVFVGTEVASIRRRLSLLAGELGVADRLVWAGERGDMVAVYGALDLVVSASLSEGLPNVLGEAMACGVPCVATDVGDSALVVDDPERVVPPGDVPALARAIVRQLRSGAAVPDPGLRTGIERRFGLDAMVGAFEAAFGGMCAGDRGREDAHDGRP